jgi:hypothetical protein
MDVFTDIKLFLFQASRNPFVSLNLVFTLILTFSAMEKFGRTGPQDVTYFTDMSFTGSARIPDEARTAGIPVLPDIELAADTVCLDGESPHNMYNLDGCFGGVLSMGRSGIFDVGSIGFEQNSFNVPHFLWVSSWFVTPIALFLVANATFRVFNQWMWWGLYTFIMLWDVVGLVLMLVWHQSPMYNKIIAFVYFAFSSLLMVSVRETWRVLSGQAVRDDNGDDVTMPMKSHHPSGVPQFMQGLSLGVRFNEDTPTAVYTPVPSAPPPPNAPPPRAVYVPISSDNVPIVLAHTFTRTVLILSDFFFLVPVVASTAFVMSQERAVPFDVQVRAWQASLLFAVVVVLEKARKTRLSYITDTVLVMAAVIALSNVLYSTIPEIIWTLVNIRMGLSLIVIYTCLILMILVAMANVGVNMVYVTFGGNDKVKMEAWRSADPLFPIGDGIGEGETNQGQVVVAPAKQQGLQQARPTATPTTPYTRVVVAMYYVNVCALVVVKLLLLVVVILGHMQNRRGKDGVISLSTL